MSARFGSETEPDFVAGAPTRPMGEHGFDVPAWQRAGCLRNPCSLDPDPALFFASPELRQIRDTLLATMRGEPASVSVLTGEAGIGKTALLREIESALAQARSRVVLLSCAHVEAPWRDVLDAIPASAALLIDDAQNCSEASLDELEHWLTTGAGGRSGLHTLISARPEAAPRLRRLVEAAFGAGLATTSVTLEPFDAVMVGEFLAHRLWRAGFTGAWPLAEDNVHRIADLSGGVPAKILSLAATEFESAWTEEAVFIRPKLEASLPVPTAPPAPTMETAPRRRLVSDPGFRTAVAASVLLAVAGTAGWLAWRTVATARLGVVEVAPPAVPPTQTVAIASPARTVEPPGPLELKAVATDAAPPLPRPPAEQMPLAAAAPAESAPAFGTMLLAARDAEPIPMPKPTAEPEPLASSDRTDDVAVAVTSPPSADAPVKMEPPAIVETAPTEPPTLAIVDNKEEKAAPVVAAAPLPAEPETIKAAAPVLTQLAQAQVTQDPATPPAVAADPPPAAPILPQPKVEETPVAVPSAAPQPQPEAPPAPPAAAAPPAEPAVAAPTPAPPVTPAAPPAAATAPKAPGLPVIAPSAGVPPAADSPPAAATPPSTPAATPPARAVQRLTPAQISTYVRRGDELVQNGDIAAARLMYERAAAAGDPEGMRALGRTYDPRMLRQWGVVGMPADQARADEWYRKAAEAQRAAQARQ